MKTNKFPTTEQEVIAFELKYKDNYKQPKEWPDIKDIINSKPLTIHGVSIIFLSVKQLKEACKKHPYLLLRFKSGHQMGVNTKMAEIILKNKTYNDESKTSYVSFLPCDLNTYITNKHVFIKN